MGDIVNSALVAAGVSAAISLVIAWIQLRQGLDSQRAQSQLDISTKYDRMVDYRLEHPEVLSLARHWRRECWDAVYDQKSDADRQWAYYYGYIELCVTYCNAVLHSKAKGFLDPDVYEYEHEPLIRLLLVEHYPILSEIARPGGYVTKYLVDHIQRLRKRDWDWENEHRRYMAIAPEADLTSAST